MIQDLPSSSKTAAASIVPLVYNGSTRTNVPERKGIGPVVSKATARCYMKLEREAVDDLNGTLSDRDFEAFQGPSCVSGRVEITSLPLAGLAFLPKCFQVSWRYGITAQLPHLAMFHSHHRYAFYECPLRSLGNAEPRCIDDPERVDGRRRGRAIRS